MINRPPVRPWLQRHRITLAFAALLLLLIGLRGYWAPDEPDFAQCVKEMRLRGAWLLPWLNGEVYTEKPILFYWMMRISAQVLEPLSAGLGFDRGIAPWALRLPSVVAAVGALWGTLAWARRFRDDRSAELAGLVLATTPIWLWQAQAIQIDMVFSALLAGSWLCWISGYAILRELAPSRFPGEARRFFLAASALLGLAVLAKGPLALVLSFGLIAAFLAWQRDGKALLQSHPIQGLALLTALILPWYLAAAWKGGPQYLQAMLIRQNFLRALDAWDHVQPWWRYLSYVAADFLPWSLALPPALFILARRRRDLDPIQAFTVLAWMVPLLLLSASKSKQGKYLLMAYPFLALTLATELPRLSEAALRRLRLAFGTFFTLPGLALLVLGFIPVGGRKLQAQLLPFMGPLRLLGLTFLAGGLWILLRRSRWEAQGLALQVAASLGLVFVLGLPWVFRRLDPLKDYRGWAVQTEPLLQGRRVYFWGDIRSGAMIYSDRLMPVIADPARLRALGSEDRLISTRRRWKPGTHGLDESVQRKFQVIYEQQQGGDGLLLLAPCP